MHQPQLNDGPPGAPASGTPAARTDRPGPKRRRLVIAAASLAAVLIAALGADRMAAAQVEDRTATAFQDGMGTAERPSVHVSGFPVLTQLAQGSLRHVDLTAHDIPANGTTRRLPVTRLTMGIDDLKTAGKADEVLARQVGASAFLSYGDLSNVPGVRLGQGDGPGRIDATVTLPLVGEVTVSAAVAASEGNRIAFTDVRTVRGSLIAPVKRLLDQVLAEPIALQNIPEGLGLRSVTTAQDGITADFTGDSVVFRPSASSTT